MKKTCYEEDLYLSEDMRALSYLLEFCDEFAKKRYGVVINKELFVNKFMVSKTREGMDIGWPKYFGQSAGDTFQDFVDHELGSIEELVNGINDSDSFTYYELHWIGMMYAYIHYKTRLLSVDIFRKLPLSFMREFYITGHEMGNKAAFRKIEYMFE